MAHLLATAMLLAGFALLCQRRVSARVSCCAAQAGLLAAACVVQAWQLGSLRLALLAGLIALVGAVALPLALHRAIAGADGEATRVDVLASAALGVALTGLAALAVPPAADAGAELALAVAVVLLGVQALATSRTGSAQIVGLLSAGNGLVLAAVSLAGVTR